MERVFLDANVMFSAAWRRDAGVAVLWKLRGVKLVTSAYAVEEARRNLDTDEQRGRLEGLLAYMEVLSSQAVHPVPTGIDLPEKDVPILVAAVASRCAYLVTGDRRHFGPLMGGTVEGVAVLTPAQFLRVRRSG